MWKTRLLALFILILGFGVGYFVYSSEPRLNITPHHVKTPSIFSKSPFKLGLDLSGGTHLVYDADVSKLESSDIKDSMDSLRDVIERRVNLFGVSEPIVQVEEGGFASTAKHRLTVDLPGVTDIQKAVELIGQTPLLVFKIERPEGPEKEAILKKLEEAQKLQQEGKPITFNLEDPYYIDSALTGRYLSKASLQFDPNTGEPKVSLQFNDEGTKIFADITKANVGKTVAIYLDGQPISAPKVNEEIKAGQAVISGSFSPQEAKTLVGRLNSGALPVPISLVSTQSIGPTLGEKAVQSGSRAAMFGFLAVALFLIIWYRLPGIIAVVALCIYIVITLALYKLIPVTLTAAGIAGFIISIGMAVDANVLIFERIKEEIKNGRTIRDAVHAGFERAWFSIRDSNTSSIITSVILFWFGTSLIKGFALTFGLGVIVSLVSAISITRLFLYSLNKKSDSKFMKFLYSSGISK
jgi:protein-export membrane protein SecD